MSKQSPLAGLSARKLRSLHQELGERLGETEVERAEAEREQAEPDAYVKAERAARRSLSVRESERRLHALKRRRSTAERALRKIAGKDAGVELAAQILRDQVKHVDAEERRGKQAKPTTTRRKLNPQVAARRAIVANNPQFSAEQLCRRFDLDGIPVPFAGETSWADAYKKPDLRQKIHVILSKDRKLAKQ